MVGYECLGEGGESTACGGLTQVLRIILEHLTVLAKWLVKRVLKTRSSKCVRQKRCGFSQRRRRLVNEARRRLGGFRHHSLTQPGEAVIATHSASSVKGLALRASVAKGNDSRVVAANRRLTPRKFKIQTVEVLVLCEKMTEY